MKTTRILRCLFYSVIISVLWFARDVEGQAAAPILLARWSSETTDTIGLTDGEFAGMYDSDFSLIQSFTLPPIPSPSQIFFQASVWSPDLNYVHRVVLYDDTYTGPSPDKATLQVWRVNTQQLVFEYFGLSIHSGVTWNQQSTRLAFAIPTGLGSDNLLIFDTAGNQIAELTPPVSGLIDRIAWNSDGNLIAFNTNSNLHIWDFALNQYLASPTNSFEFESSLYFSAISNQLAYVEYIDNLDSETISIWDPDTSQEVGQLLGHQGMIFTFDWQADRIASVGLDGTVRIWNSQTFQQVAEYPQGFITQVQLSPDSNTLLTNGPDPSTYQTVDPLTGQVLSANYCAITIAAGDVPGLVSAINAANANPDPDTLCLAAGTFTLTAVDNTGHGPNGLPSITSAITLRGLGSGATLTRDPAAPTFRILHVQSSSSLTLDNLTLTNGSATGDGGAVFGDGPLTVTHSHFNNNHAADEGGAIAVEQGVAAAITDSTFDGNTSVADGGAMEVDAGATLTVGGSTFTNNTSTAGDGGAISADSATMTLSSSTFQTNTADDAGGALHAKATDLTVTGSTLSGNSGGMTASHGGGIYATGHLTVTDSTISGNGVYSGGGIYFNNATGTASIQGTTSIANNRVVHHGGGLYVAGGSVTLDGASVTGNTADTSSGAGIYNLASLTVTNSTISGNSASHNGGGIWNSGTLSLTDTTLSSNQSDLTDGHGGGIYTTAGSVSVSGGELNGNQAHDGAGLYVGGGTVDLSTTLLNNAANDDGGGAYLVNGAGLTVDRATFESNRAADEGGGLSSSGAFAITNSHFLTNSAHDGGAIYTSTAGTNAVNNSCIAGNIVTGNTSGVLSTAATLNATGNWWGAADGPSGAGPGSGDEVSAHVDFSGFLTEGCPDGTGAGGLGLLTLGGSTPLLDTDQFLDTETPQTLPFTPGLADQTLWRVSGTWDLEPVATRSGLSWAADAAPRGLTQVLELRLPLALSNRGRPQVSFWQRVALNASDRLTVEVQVDGTTAWTVVDTQSGVTTGWEQRAVDLSPFRGQTIRLRCRLTTSEEDARTGAATGVWLDSLSLQAAR